MYLFGIKLTFFNMENYTLDEQCSTLKLCIHLKKYISEVLMFHYHQLFINLNYLKKKSFFKIIQKFLLVVVY